MRGRELSRWRKFGSALLASITIVAAGCSSGTDDNDSAGEQPTPGATVELDEIGSSLVDVESIDRRSALLAELGSPDAFVITVDDIDGVVSRFESWSYFDALTQIDLVDGELLWDIEIPGLPDGSLLPIGYSPMEFTMLSSVDETMAMLDDVEMQPVLAAADFEVDGAEMWAGEQLALAFVDDQLIYVETFPLAPDEPEVVG